VLAASEDQYDTLAHWLAEVVSPTDSLLDIGAGDGDDSYYHLVRPLVGRVVGVDPDPHASARADLDEWHNTSIETYAASRLSATDPERFDLALAIYVLEHVVEPESFFSSARACLRPGGSLFVITPNLWHYFGLLAKGSMALGIEDRLLGALRTAHPDHHHAAHQAAHFPVAYRANSVRALARLGKKAGYSALQIRHLENPAVFETYFPGRSVAFPRAYSRAVHRLGRPELFGTLICRFVN
jgi:SAM-dependent methyltransferase